MKKGQTLRGEIQKLQSGPIQYQKGWTEFYKLKFKLTPDVLIPRPETELLVDETLLLAHQLENLKNQKNNDVSSSEKRLTIIDIGTGSGCIAISIAKNLPIAKIFAIDVSNKALEIAILNARLNHVENQIIFLESDLLSIFCHSEHIHFAQCRLREEYKPGDIPFTNAQGDTKIDILVANLPYIPSTKLMLIDPMVKDFEPKIALDGGIDGFELYRKLFTQMRDQKIYPKYLVAEIDGDQEDLAKGEVAKYFPHAELEVKKDYSGFFRILIIKF